MDSAIKSRNDGSVDSGVSDYVIPWLVEDPDAVFGACRAVVLSPSTCLSVMSWRPNGSGP
jgi:hypothetical protein